MPDTLLSTQVVLRRNFQDQPFVSTMLDADKAACAQRVHKALDSLESTWTLYHMRDLGKQDFSILQAEVGLSDDLWSSKAASLFIREDKQATVITNAEDHVQVQVRAESSAPTDAIAQAKVIAGQIGEEWPYAKDENLGWLTARPILAGSGLQIAADMHLPMLSMMQQLKGITQAMLKEQLFQLDTMPGQGDKNPGALYTLRSMFNAYGSTGELAQAAAKQAQDLARKEENLRDKILVRSIRSTYVDQVWRAYGVLKYARRLTEQEFLGLWSKLRLGTLSGLIDLPLETIDALREKASTAGLLGLYEDARDEHALHFFRADVVRAELNGGL